MVAASRVGELRAALEASGARAAGSEVAEALRIEAGVPRFHRDMDEETIPLEAGIEARALSTTKGCYVGQEVIVRVLHRGHGRVARKLVGLVAVTSALPDRGSVVLADGREVGRVTSSALSPAVGAPIAFAYVHRDYTSPGTNVAIAGAEAGRDAAPATVTGLPFVRR
jgi:folate-binding protein YgfZ